MPDELRVAFHHELEEIDQRVLQLFALVAESLAAATDAFLSGDRDAARALIAQDRVVDELYHDIEGVVQQQFALQSPMAKDMRLLLSVLRIVPELERSADLAKHIATRAERGLAAELTPRIRGLVEQMGQIGLQLWRESADAYADRDGEAADRLNAMDDELDELHIILTAELVSGSLTLPVALEMALVARFYERLGDHAVHIAERVRYLAVGDT
jgi:phosphate transport system protein